MDFFLGIWDAIDKALIRENRYEFYLSGIGNTLLISLFAVILGFLIGAFVAVVKQLCAGRRGIGWIAKICDLYVFVIRGTPVLVQLLLINAVLFNYRGANAIVAAVMCFGINSGAYVAEIVRAGIESIDKGQTEAGRSLGRCRSDNVAYRTSAGYKEHTSRTRQRIYRAGKGNFDRRLHCGNRYHKGGTVCRLKNIRPYYSPAYCGGILSDTGIYSDKASETA